MTTTTATTWGRSLMAEMTDRAQHLRQDARNLWVPVTTVLAVFFLVAGGLIGAGMWIARTGDRAATTDTLAAKLESMDSNTRSQLSEMRGQLGVVIGMNQTLSDTKSEVTSLRRELERVEREHRLLKDYVEGRMGSMPYRTPTREGG